MEDSETFETWLRQMLEDSKEKLKFSLYSPSGGLVLLLKDDSQRDNGFPLIPFMPTKSKSGRVNKKVG